ncbi:MAG TPA: site-specific integrase [Burkholderiaceae bacterium]|nr:site-specific integrase [Burkholderiaceae bacterium]
MESVERYLQLADRPNTQRSYAAAVRHFEIEWRGLLPATPDSIAEYLAAYASSQSVSTLQTRLAGLSKWHQDHGFLDPTKSPHVRRVLKGIRTAHNAPQKQAKPVEFDLLEQVSGWLSSELEALSDDGVDRTARLRSARDRAMLLLGFWRGFRSDELAGLRFENVTVEPGIRMTCLIPRSKADRGSTGRQFECPALTRLCPVEAFLLWKEVSGLTKGPVFRRIDRWGHMSNRSVSPKSIVPWLRGLFTEAGVADAGAYSSHSLRRGFANWARSSGWDIKELMDYVGWRDVNSAMRYLDDNRQGLALRFEQGLAATKSLPSAPVSRTTGRRRPSSPNAGAKIIPLPVRGSR